MINPVSRRSSHPAQPREVLAANTKEQQELRELHRIDQKRE